MIYDCFTYFNEIELLELRLKTLSDAVDYFVLVEANKSHAGEDKEFHFENNKNRVAEYLDKIIHVKVYDMPGSDNAWDREGHQRNCIIRGLQNCLPDDLVIISDLDEIPNPEVLKSLLNKQVEVRFSKRWIKNKALNLYFRNKLLDIKPLTFEQDLFYYFVNCKLNQKWNGSVITKFKHLTVPPDHFRRNRRKFPKLRNGGWHFSYLGGVDRILTKIKSFAHTEYNLPEITSPEWIKDKILSGQDLYGRDLKLEFVNIDSKFPAKTASFLEKYPYLHLSNS